MVIIACANSNGLPLAESMPRNLSQTLFHILLFEMFSFLCRKLSMNDMKNMPRGFIFSKLHNKCMQFDWLANIFFQSEGT